MALPRPTTGTSETNYRDLHAAEVAAHDLDRSRAVRVVAGRSHGVDDCVELLAMLGLTGIGAAPARPTA